MPRQGQLHHAASAWDSDNVAYVGMEYPNMGACSQRAPFCFYRGDHAGGCSQDKTIVSVDTTSAGTTVGELASVFLPSRCPFATCQAVFSVPPPLKVLCCNCVIQFNIVFIYTTAPGFCVS